MNWKINQEYPDYEISDTGQIRKAASQKIVNQRMDSKDFLSVKIKNSEGKFMPVRVHRLVYDTFICYHKNILGRIVHKDGNRINNHKNNLKLKKIIKQELSSNKKPEQVMSNDQATQRNEKPNLSGCDNNAGQDIRVMQSGAICISKRIFDKIPRSYQGKILSNFLNSMLSKIPKVDLSGDIFSIDKFYASFAIRELTDMLCKSQSGRKPFRFDENEWNQILSLIREILSDIDLTQH